MQSQYRRILLSGLAISLALPLCVRAWPAPDDEPAEAPPLPPFIPPPSWLDVNNDGQISPMDALLIINYLNNPANPRTVPPGPADYDVNGDGIINAIDILYIIDWLNTHGPGPLPPPDLPPVPEPPLPPDIA